MSEISFRALYVGVIRYDTSQADFMHELDLRMVTQWPENGHEVSVMIGDISRRVPQGGAVLFFDGTPVQTYDDETELAAVLARWDAS
jgi:hypothetical protein